MNEGRPDLKASDTRSLILDATEQLMREEGYAAVSSRKVAAKAGLKSKLLHYYFRTMDELFIAAFNRLEEAYDARLARALASERPLHDLWALGRDPWNAKLILEFNALATNRPAVREVIARSARRDRRIMTAALDEVFRKYGIDRKEFPPKVVAILMAGLIRALSTEKALRVEDGHEEALLFVDRLLHQLEAPRHDRDSGEQASEPADSSR